MKFQLAKGDRRLRKRHIRNGLFLDELVVVFAIIILDMTSAFSV